MSDLETEHINAIRLAIESGIKLIDTSTNYMDGGAERAVAKAMQGMSDAQTADVEIISKFGYIQGSTMKRLQEGETFNNVVRYSEHLYHCIDADFLHDQLTQSLSRLNRDQIGCYMIQEPEYFLLDAISRGISKEDRLDEMLQRILDAFTALEKEVLGGRIKSYGISSNGFSYPHNTAEFLPYEDLVTLAENAAQHAGADKHHFTTIELPINLLEHEGLACAAWAKRNGLRVLANRPLDAHANGVMYRLADYAEPADYYHHLNEMLEITDNETLMTLHTLIGELDGHKHRFGWVGEYRYFYHAQIVPHLRQAFITLEEGAREQLAASLDQFFYQYERMVAYECSKNTRQALADQLEGCQKRMQECAVNFLQAQENIDYILVGMRKSSYVVDIMGINL